MELDLWRNRDLCTDNLETAGGLRLRIVVTMNPISFTEQFMSLPQLDLIKAR